MLPVLAPLDYMAKGRGNSQQNMPKALQQLGEPMEELPEIQRQEIR